MIRMVKKIKYDYISFSVRIIVMLFVFGMLYNAYQDHLDFNDRLKKINPEFEPKGLDWFSVFIFGIMGFPALVFIIVDLKDRNSIKKTNSYLDKFSKSLGFRKELNTFQQILKPKKYMLKGHYKSYEVTLSAFEGNATYLPVKFSKFYFMIMMKSGQGFIETISLWQDEKGINTKRIYQLKSGQQPSKDNEKVYDFSGLNQLPKNCSLQFARDGYIIYTDELDIFKLKNILELSTEYAKRIK
jgi:hypothetical protein